MWYIFNEPPSSASCFATRLITHGGAGRHDGTKPDVRQSPPLCFPRVYGYPASSVRFTSTVVEFPKRHLISPRRVPGRAANRADNRG